jgi:hypothetical protein
MQVKKLLAKDVDIYYQDADGHTALHLAATNGHVQVVKLLADVGGLVLIMKASKTGQTAHAYAGTHGHKKAVEALQHAHTCIMDESRLLEERQVVCWQKADELAANYVPQKGVTVLTMDEYKKMVYHMLLGTWDAHRRDPKGNDYDKYAVQPKALVCGEFEHAAKGFFKLLNVTDDEVYKRASAGVLAIEEEVKALGDKDVAQQLEYILWHRAREKIFPNGIRDKGHAGMMLHDFLHHEHAKKAELLEVEVVALRLYTTSAFKHINDPLRDQSRVNSGKPHPMPVTVMLISRGIKKLRAVDADSAAATQSMVLWRGMRDIKSTDHFANKGGTEVCELLQRVVNVPFCVL